MNSRVIIFISCSKSQGLEGQMVVGLKRSCYVWFAVWPFLKGADTSAAAASAAAVVMWRGCLPTVNFREANQDLTC